MYFICKLAIFKNWTKLCVCVLNFLTKGEGSMILEKGQCVRLVNENGVDKAFVYSDFRFKGELDAPQKAGPKGDREWLRSEAARHGLTATERPSGVMGVFDLS